ncbi:MAG TPA: hypothetical protein VFQ67_03970 [Allosphingosinicella sp.]|jgi:hypothetical protein|nr:hypothetical protein [Allosphingosinicella sp.]
MKAFVPLMALAMICACAKPSVPVPARSPAARLASAEVAGQVRRCYRSPRIPSAGKRIVTHLLVRYSADGMLVGLPLLIGQEGLTPESRPYAGRMIEAAKLAVVRCNPVRLPAPLDRRRSSVFYLTFSPQMMA